MLYRSIQKAQVGDSRAIMALLFLKITMEASANNGVEFSGSDSTFIEVIPSDLVVQTVESPMNQWTVGPAVLVTLAPRDYSYDPDSDTSLGMDNVSV